MRFYNFSERAYQQERARIKARSQQRDAIIHAEINKVKQEQQALEEQRQKKAQELRLQQIAEMKRKAEEQAKLEAQCENSVLQISQLYTHTQQLLDSPFIS